MWHTRSIKEWNDRATDRPCEETDAGADARCLPVRAVYIGSQDDPLCPVNRLQSSLHQDFLDHERAIVVATNTGGHCAWIDGLNTSSWLTDSLSELLAHFASGSYNLPKEIPTMD